MGKQRKRELIYDIWEVVWPMLIGMVIGVVIVLASLGILYVLSMI